MSPQGSLVQQTDTGRKMLSCPPGTVCGWTVSELTGILVMTLEDMRIFIMVVNTGSFTAAAERLMISKQFVSRRVAALETRLATRLLIRNT